MATGPVSDITPSTLMSLPPEERRKILLESFREGYASSPKVSRPVSSEVSRYVSQITSERWRDKIWRFDDSTKDMQCEASTSESDEPRPLVIYGYDLHSEDYLKEREMIARWNIVERELHFPNLEKEYVRKRYSKTQSDVDALESCQTPSAQDVHIGEEPTTEDIVMKEGQESPQKVTEDNETSAKVSGQETSTEAGESESEEKELHLDIKVSGEVVQQESSSSVQELQTIGLDERDLGRIETSPQQESEKKSLVPHLESSANLEEKETAEKMAAVPEDSKVFTSFGKKIKMPDVISSAETSVDTASGANSEDLNISKESEDVSTFHESGLTESSKTETSDATSTDKISVSKLQFLAALEVKVPEDKMEATTVFEDSNVASSEKVMETSETTTTESSSEKVVKEPADKRDNETVSERTEVSGTDLETSGTTLLGKRKADSLSEYDPDEKRTKKTSFE